MMKLNLENQLRKIICSDMEIKVIKLSRESVTSYDEQKPFREQAGKEFQNPAGFNKDGEFVRNAYLIYHLQYMRDQDRIAITNKKLYIEATFNSITDTSYEVWLLRTFMPDCCMTVTFGMMLIPKEQVYATDPKLWPKGTPLDKIEKEGSEKQRHTLKLCMSSLIRGVYPYTQTNIFMSTKKGVDFLMKVKQAVREHDPKI